MSFRKHIPRETRKHIHEKTGGTCAYCGQKLTLSATQIDHVVPFEFAELLQKMGIDVNSDENLFPACRSCNNYKHSMTLEKMRNAVEAWPAVLNRDSTTYRNAVRFEMVIPAPHKVRFHFEKIGLRAPDWLTAPWMLEVEK